MAEQSLTPDMTFCEHDRWQKRPLRIRGFESPQMVCADCWKQAVGEGLVLDAPP